MTDNKIDFAIYDKINDSETRISTPLIQDNIVACCSANQCYKDNISFEQLSKMQLLLREKGSGMRNCIDSEFSKHGYTQNIVAESTSTLGLVELAEAGLGYALVPQSLAEKLLSTYKIKLLTINGVYMKKSYNLIYNRKKFLNPVLEDVIKTLDILRNKIN